MLPSDKIRIGAVDWKLETDDRAEEDSVFGTTLHSKGVVRIAPGLGEWKERETLVHEVLHVITRTVWPPKDKEELSEKQVKALAAMLTGFLRDNPVVARWLISIG